VIWLTKLSIKRITKKGVKSNNEMAEHEADSAHQWDFI
jgi:hypothetical protein